jgi:hypothetical protein
MSHLVSIITKATKLRCSPDRSSSSISNNFKRSQYFASTDCSSGSLSDVLLSAPSALHRRCTRERCAQTPMSRQGNRRLRLTLFGRGGCRHGHSENLKVTRFQTLQLPQLQNYRRMYSRSVWFWTHRKRDCGVHDVHHHEVSETWLDTVVP